MMGFNKLLSQPKGVHHFFSSVSKVGLHVALPAGAVKETDESPKSSEDNESSGQVGMLGVFFHQGHMGVEPKIGGKTTKMDGENNGKHYFLMDDLGIPLFLETPIFITYAFKTFQNSSIQI